MGPTPNNPVGPPATPPTQIYPAPMQYASPAPPPGALYTPPTHAPPPPQVTVYTVPASPPPPPSPPVQAHVDMSNPGMAAVPDQPLQQTQKPPKTTTNYDAAKKSIVQAVTNIVAIGIFYGLQLHPGPLIDGSRIMLIVSVAFLLVNLGNLILLSLRSRRPISKYISIVFSITTSLILMLVFIGLDALISRRQDLFGDTGLPALIGSLGLFAGLGLGSTIMYAIYGS